MIKLREVCQYMRDVIDKTEYGKQLKMSASHGIVLMSRQPSGISAFFADNAIAVFAAGLGGISVGISTALSGLLGGARVIGSSMFYGMTGFALGFAATLPCCGLGAFIAGPAGLAAGAVGRTSYDIGPRGSVPLIAGLIAAGFLLFKHRTNVNHNREELREYRENFVKSIGFHDSPSVRGEEPRQRRLEP
ncbi:hypothetical protein AQUSIP_11240 [Aquicella siphonis]|uniref:Uncharacterized protein n=1 Tax=Aquicella siphonis TaxID=254247 RepID=A0A5E4PHA6_9COXI|nr:hypothetical protein [Aquicella siphonis]VVC75827.1 hypothetical protein AQUSIP_11240 [Aquicella siphonis]